MRLSEMPEAPKKNEWPAEVFEEGGKVNPALIQELLIAMHNFRDHNGAAVPLYAPGGAPATELNLVYQAVLMLYEQIEASRKARK